MQTENLAVADKVMDMRSIPCSMKHGLIIQTGASHFIAKQEMLSCGGEKYLS